MKTKSLIRALIKARKMSSTPLAINGGDSAAVTLTRENIGPGYQLEIGAHPTSAKGPVIAQFICGKVRGMPVYETAADGSQSMNWGRA